MAVNKFNSRHGYFVRIMQERTAAVRKTASDTVRAAQEHVLRSEEVVSRALATIQRAEEILAQVGSGRNRRHRT